MNEEYIFAEDIDQEEASIRHNKNARPQNYGLVITALIFGIISLVFFLFGLNIISAIVSVILAIIYLATCHSKKGIGMAVTAIVCSVLSVVLTICSWTIVFTNPHIDTLFDDFIDQQGDYYLDDNMQDFFNEYEGGGYFDPNYFDDIPDKDDWRSDYDLDDTL